MEGDRTLCICACLRIIFQSTPSAWRETGGQTKTVRREGISIHSLRMEGDRLTFVPSSTHLQNFNPLPPHGGRLCLSALMQPEPLYFNPLPPHGGRLGRPWDVAWDALFQSTPSAWRETCEETGISFNTYQFQSTPSAWRETALSCRTIARQDISIHSLRMEGDVKSLIIIFSNLNFNPLPPHGGRRR